MPKDRFRRPTERTSGIANTTGTDMPTRPGLSGMSGPFRHWRQPVPFGLFRGSIPGQASLPFGQASFRGSLMLPMRRSKEMYRGRCFTGHVRLLQNPVRHAGRRPERGLIEERNSDAGIGGAAAARFPKTPLRLSNAVQQPGIGEEENASPASPAALNQLRGAHASASPPCRSGLTRAREESQRACLPALETGSAGLPRFPAFLLPCLFAIRSMRAFPSGRFPSRPPVLPRQPPLFPRIPSGISGYPCLRLRFSG